MLISLGTIDEEERFMMRQYDRRRYWDFVLLRCFSVAASHLTFCLEFLICIYPRSFPCYTFRLAPKIMNIQRIMTPDYLNCCIDRTFTLTRTPSPPRLISTSSEPRNIFPYQPSTPTILLKQQP
jgi:hypothetical protein